MIRSIVSFSASSSCSQHLGFGSIRLCHLFDSTPDCPLALTPPGSREAGVGPGGLRRGAQQARPFLLQRATNIAFVCLRLVVRLFCGRQPRSPRSPIVRSPVEESHRPDYERAPSRSHGQPMTSVVILPTFGCDWIARSDSPARLKGPRGLCRGGGGAG